MQGEAECQSPALTRTALPETESDHFMKCPGCGQWFDMRDLAQVFSHVHDAEIEMVEGPEPLREPKH